MEKAGVHVHGGFYACPFQAIDIGQCFGVEGFGCADKGIGGRQPGVICSSRGSRIGGNGLTL